MQQNLNKYQLLKMKQLAKIQQQQQYPPQIPNADDFRQPQEENYLGNNPAEQQNVNQDQQQQNQIYEYKFDDEQQEEQKDEGINQNQAPLHNQAQIFRNLIENTNNFELKQKNNNTFSLFPAQNMNPQQEQQFQQEQRPESAQQPLNWGYNVHPTFQLNPIAQQANVLNIFQNHPFGQAEQQQQEQQEQQQQQAPTHTQYSLGTNLNPNFRLIDQQQNQQEQQQNQQPNPLSWMFGGNAAAPQQDHNSNSKVELTKPQQFQFQSEQKFHINNTQKYIQQPQNYGGFGQFNIGNQQQQSFYGQQQQYQQQNNSYFQQQQQPQQFNLFNNNNNNLNSNGFQLPGNQSSAQQSDSQIWYTDTLPQKFQDFKLSCPLQGQQNQNYIAEEWNKTLNTFQLGIKPSDQGQSTVMEVNLDYFNEEQPIQQPQAQSHQGFPFIWG